MRRTVKALCSEALADVSGPSDTELGERFIRLSACQVVVNGTAPEWIQLVPAGDEITALDGRKFKNTDPAAVVARFNKHPLDIPLDWEHATEVKAPKGEMAPAAGWIKELEVRAGSIWARIEWTARGSASVCSKEYKYVSPAFTHDKTGKVHEIASAALTNHPALVLKALARAQQDQDTATASATHGESDMDKELMAILGLKPETSKEDLYSHVKGLVKMSKKSKFKDDEKGDEKNDGGFDDDEKGGEKPIPDKCAYEAKIAELETSLASAKAAQPSLANYVPRADYELVTAQCSALQAEKQAEKDAAHKAQVDNEIDGATKAGKITPATVGFYRSQCSTEAGLQTFRDFLKVAPVVAPDNVVAGTAPARAGRGKKVLCAQERDMIAKMGLTEEEYLGGSDINDPRFGDSAEDND
jgi:phage I-like protein